MKLLTFVPVLLFSLFVSGLVAGQDATPPAAAKSRYVSTIGEVVSIDLAAKQIKVKTDKGEEIGIALEDRTSFLRMPPGEKELTKATRIEAKDVSVGDRVLARTRPGEGGAMSPAASIIVMTKSDLATFHEKSRAEWEKRGTVGTAVSVDPAANQIVISVPTGLTPKDVKNVTLDTTDKSVYRRYAPGDWKFQDAVASKVTEIKPGDRIRVLGDKNEDGSHIKAEEIVSGTFRNLAATIISIDPATNTLKVNDLSVKKGAPLTVKIIPETAMKRLPERMSMMLARAQNGGAGGPGAGGGAGRGPGGGGAAAGGEGGPGAGRGPGGGGAPNLAQMMERVPPITLADLKAGDALVISAVAGKDASEVTAITAIAGVEAILTAPSKNGGGSAVGGNWNFGDIGLPQ